MSSQVGIVGRISQKEIGRAIFDDDQVVVFLLKDGRRVQGKINTIRAGFPWRVIEGIIDDNTHFEIDLTKDGTASLRIRQREIKRWNYIG